MEKKQEIGRAFTISLVCVLSYIACYYMRNILSVVTPEMEKSGVFTKASIGTLSSLYMLAYAVGQLINGIVGDKVRARYMVSGGLLICGAASMAFALVPPSLEGIGKLLFIAMGFSLSMLRGPLVKTVSENMQPVYARIACVFLSFASFAGPLIASLIALAVGRWQGTFLWAGLSCIVIGAGVFLVLSVLEAKQLIRPKAVSANGEKKHVLDVFHLENFVFYMFVGGLVEISASSIMFWLPTYLEERLLFSPAASKLWFTVISTVRSFTPFVAIFVYQAVFRGKDMRMIRWAFFAAAVLFTGVLFLCEPYISFGDMRSIAYINIVLFVLALVSVGFASSLLWSVYIPNQGKTGLVSTVNGMLDFSGYCFAAAANKVFSVMIDPLGWGGILVMWIALMVSGILAVAVSVRWNAHKKRTEQTEA